MNTTTDTDVPPQGRSALLSATGGQKGWRAMSFLRRPAWVIGILVFLLLGWQWFELREQVDDLQQELTKRMADGDATSREYRRQNQELMQSLVARLSLLEARQAEAQSQQAALETVYQELSRSRDERILAEIEQSLMLAAQQLQLTGNVEAALAVLQGIDARLVRAGQNRLLPLRKLINRDIDRLKALPLADVPGIALKLEGVIAAVDTLPLAFEQRTRAEPPAKPRNSASAKVAVADAEPNLWQGMVRDLWAEFKQLIRVERIGQPEAVLLAPSQIFFLRENLKLRLIDARLALLQRDGRTYREDLRQSRELLERYFDTRDKASGNAIALLKSLAVVDLSLDAASLAETLASVRSYKLGPNKDAAGAGR